MTYKEFVLSEFGYETQTTFWDDFSIAEMFGVSAIQDTFDRAFREWKSNHIFLTELVMVLNHKVWAHHNKNAAFEELYLELFDKTNSYAMKTIKGDELAYFYRTTD